MAVITKEYLASPNCRVELRAAIEHGKPLLLLVETDPAHGAPTLHDLETERSALPEGERSVADTLISRFASALEWHRENHLKRAVVSMIVSQLPCLQAPPDPPSAHSEASGATASQQSDGTRAWLGLRDAVGKAIGTPRRSSLQGGSLAEASASAGRP